MEGEGRALWDRREGFLADRHIRCHRLIFIILEMCVCLLVSVEARRWI